MSMEVKIRQAVERAICARVVEDLLAAGYALAVDNGEEGEEDLLPATSVQRDVMEALFSTDEDLLFVYPSPEAEPEDYLGWVKFIYGNSGYDVVSDYTQNLEGVLSAAMQLSQNFEEDPSRALLAPMRQHLEVAQFLMAEAIVFLRKAAGDVDADGPETELADKLSSERAQIMELLNDQ